MASNSVESVHYLVRKDDWSQGRFETAPIARLEPGQVLFRVDRFALTSNNISYAAAGDMLDYWGFFPATGGWGRIPTMGYADVIDSRHKDVSEGERVFGFFPMASHLVIQAEDVNHAQFVDGAAHRAGHAQAYRQYLRASSDATYEEKLEDETLLLRGLFMTSFLVESFLADNAGFGAATYVVGSASSKTGIALAYLLAHNSRGQVIGVTSERNRAFVQDLGFYDQTIDYDDVASLPTDVPTAFVDHSGNGPFVNALHRHLGDALKYSCIVGATHWSADPRSQELPGPDPTFFFAPAEIARRIDAWGPAGFQERLGKSWRDFCATTPTWLRVERGHGTDEVERVYREILQGKAKPNEGHILSLWPAS